MLARRGTVLRADVGQHREEVLGAPGDEFDIDPGQGCRHVVGSLSVRIGGEVHRHPAVLSPAAKFATPGGEGLLAAEHVRGGQRGVPAQPHLGERGEPAQAMAATFEWAASELLANMEPESPSLPSASQSSPS